MSESVIGLLIGIGLSAACGFRIFVPFLIISLSTITGHMILSCEFNWIGSYPALIAFAIATIIEILAYLIPWVDNLLDTISIPAAVVAGTVVTASVITEMSPLLKWSLTIIAGGGVGATIQTFTAVSRVTSTTLTGGIGNPLLSIAEAGASIGMSIISITFPVLAFIIVVILISYSGKRIYSRLFKQRKINSQVE